MRNLVYFEEITEITWQQRMYLSESTALVNGHATKLLNKMSLTINYYVFYDECKYE